MNAVKSEKTADRPPKRAICLGGGGPAVGLHIGALDSLKTLGVDFGNERGVWALSCIGAWAGVLYNQAKKGREIEETYRFFEGVFRDDRSFASFPTNTVFAPDWSGSTEAMLDYLFDPKSYRNAFLPRHIVHSWMHTLAYVGKRRNWRKFSEGDFNRWTLNHVLAINPWVRFLTGLLYKSEIDGRSRLFFEDSKFLKDIKFESLDDAGKPFIFFNAFNFARKDIDIFANDPPYWTGKKHKAITGASLCACSALPFVEQTVAVSGPVYCEGALVDTVNFRGLMEEHHTEEDPLDEIWINRIVDATQIHKPKNLHDALANLCELFAATVGEDDIRLFKHKVKDNNRLPENKREFPAFHGTIIEIDVNDQINFHWSHSNLVAGRTFGSEAAYNAYKLYKKYKDEKKAGEFKDKLLMIPDDLKDHEILAAGVPLSPRRKRQNEEKLRRSLGEPSLV
jgi:predicted acylesterase/phospholipase RssA